MKEICQTCDWSATIRDSVTNRNTLDRRLVTTGKRVYFIAGKQEERSDEAKIYWSRSAQERNDGLLS